MTPTLWFSEKTFTNPEDQVQSIPKGSHDRCL